MMSRHSRRFQHLGLLLAALGFAISAAAQQAGPMPAAPANLPADQKASDQSPAQPAPAAAVPAASTAPASAPAKIIVPTGTRIPLVLHNGISTRSSRPGDPVYCETLFPILVDGHVVIPAGSYLSGEVVESKRPGRVKGRGELMLRFHTLILPNAYMVDLNATPGGSPGTGGSESIDSEGRIKGDTDKASDAGTIIKTTGAGAGIGGVATQSAKGAGIGAGIGAALGLGAVLLTRGPEAELPRGTTLDAILDHPLYLDADKAQFTGPGQSSTLPGPPDREPRRDKIPF